MLRHVLLAVVFVLGLGSSGVWAAEIRPDHPGTYTVVKGDTLWDISGRFLTHPWQWPEIWHANPQIKNPHLIYPGDVLELVYVNGKPVLRRKGSGGKTAAGAIPPLPLKLIEPFLMKAHVIDERGLYKAPYVLSFLDSSLIGGPGARAYVRLLPNDGTTSFDIVRKGKAFTDQDTGEDLGYAVRHIGRASLVRGGDPSTVTVDSANYEVARGDILIPAREITYPSTFYPKPPSVAVDGHVLAAYDAFTHVARNQAVLIDRGAADGLVPGDVLVVDNKGRTVRDDIGPTIEEQKPREVGGVPQYGRAGPVYVTLPDEWAGSVMVFQVFDRMSMALIMESARSIKLGDRIHSP